MCMGGGDTPQQPVQPAPYPYAELDIKDARAPDPNSHGNGTDAAKDTTTTKPPAGTATGDMTGANFNNIKM